MEKALIDKRKLVSFCWGCNGHVRLGYDANTGHMFFTYCSFFDEDEKCLTLKRGMSLKDENRLSPAIKKASAKNRQDCGKFQKGGFMLQVPLEQVRRGEKYIKDILG